MNPGLIQPFILFQTCLGCQAGPQDSEGKGRKWEGWLGQWHGQSGTHSQYRSQESPDASQVCRALSGNQGVRGESSCWQQKCRACPSRPSRIWYSQVPSHFRDRTQEPVYTCLPATDAELLAASGLPSALSCSRPPCMPLPDGV